MSGARDATSLPEQGVHVIEASAGTGKTFTLALLYLRAVVARDLGVRQILVVTFTDAAATDLQTRVRQVLASAERLLDAGLDAAAPQAADAPIRALLDEVQRELQLTAGHLRARVRRALASYDERAISTIHGFASRALAEFQGSDARALSAGQPVDGKSLRAEAAGDLWRARATGPDGRAWVSRYPSPEALGKALQPLVGQAHVRLLPEDLAQSADAAQSALAARFAELAANAPGDIDRALTLIADAKGVLSVAKDAYAPLRVAAARVALLQYLDTAVPDAALDPLIALLGSGALSDGRTDGAKKKELAPPAHPLFERVERLLQAHAHASRLALARERVALAAELDQRTRALARARAETCFDDLIADLASALEGASGQAIAAAMAARWPLALIDEFQDTDVRQYGIFRRIYRAQPHAAAAAPVSLAEPGAASPPPCLVLIGDPKQSIYAFRGGDVYAYLAALEDIDSGIARLDVNHRSESRVVQATNALFRDAPFQLGDIRHHDCLATEPPRRGYLDDPGRSAGLVLWDAGAGPGRGAMHARDALSEWALAACIDEIVRLLGGTVSVRGDREGSDPGRGRPLLAGDIAVLVPDNEDAAQAARALEQRGVQVALASRRSVFHGATARMLFTTLAAIAHPEDLRSLRAALAMPGLDWTLAQLLDGEDAALGEARLQVRTWHDAWRRQGAPAALAPLVARLAPSLARRADGARRLTDLRHLVERLMAAPVAQSDPHAMQAWLGERMAYDGLADEADAERPEPGGARVHVLTQHKSKGLEFGVVFLPLAWQVRAKESASDMVAFHDERGRACLDLGSPRWLAHAAIAEREGDAERVRLAYVTFTRARHRTYAVIGKVKGGRRAGLAQLLFPALDNLAHDALDAAAYRASLRARIAALAAPEGAIVLSDLPVAQGAQVPVVPPGPRPQAERLSGPLPGVVPTWSYSALKQLGRSDDDPVPATRSDEFGDADGFQGAAFGRCFHELMETLDFAAGPSALDPAAMRRLLARHGVPEAAGRTLAGLAQGTLSAELLPGLTLAQLRADQAVRELPFLLPLSGARVFDLAQDLEPWPAHRQSARLLRDQPDQLQGWLRGYLDLVFEHDGQYYVLDYKTDSLGAPEAYAGAALAEAVSARAYDLQYLIYAVALKRWLDLRFGADAGARFGGVVYLFVRGLVPGSERGVFQVRPDPGLLATIEQRLAGRHAA